MTYPDNTTALLLIDLQKGLDEEAFYGGSRNNPDAEKKVVNILGKWRAENRPVIHLQHSSTNPNSPLFPSKSGFGIKTGLEPIPGEIHLVKNVNSGFIGTGLKELLEKKGVKTIVFVGLTTDHCVSSSVRMASNLGFKAIVISDATATFNRQGIDGKTITAEQLHRAELTILNGEFATIMDSETLLKKY